MSERAALDQAPPPATDRLSDTDISKVLGLLEGSTAVELKLTVDDAPGPTLRRLGLDPVEAQPRQVYFFDTADLALSAAGLVVRARRAARDKGDTVVKMRPVDPASIAADLRRDDALKIEVDVMPGGYVCSASFKGRCSGQEVLQVSDGQLPLRSLLSRTQRSAYDAVAPNHIALESLKLLGPTFVLRVKKQPSGFDREVVGEFWLYPDGSTVLEVSTKGMPEEAFQLAAHFRAFLAERGVPVQITDGTKTATALRHFSKQLHAG